MAHALKNKKTDTNFILMFADSEMQCTFLFCRAIVMHKGIMGSEVQWKAVIRRRTVVGLQLLAPGFHSVCIAFCCLS